MALILIIRLFLGGVVIEVQGYLSGQCVTVKRVYARGVADFYATQVCVAEFEEVDVVQRTLHR